MIDFDENSSDEFKEGMYYAIYTIREKLIEMITEKNQLIEYTYVVTNSHLKEFIKSELT